MLLLRCTVYRDCSYPECSASWPSNEEGSMRGLVRWEATLWSWAVDRHMRQVNVVSWPRVVLDGII